MKTYILLFIALLFATSSVAQLEITPSTPISTYSQPQWNVDSDLNSDYMVVTYGNHNPNGSPGSSATFMSIYDNMGGLIAEDVPVFNLGSHVSVVKITPSNIIYVLGQESVKYKTKLVLRKYNTAGTLQETTIVKHFDIGMDYDMTITEDNHAVVSFFDENTLKVKSYSTNLSSFGHIDIDNVTNLAPPHKLRAQSIDYNNGYLLVGYSRGVDANNEAHIKKYNFNSTSPSSSSISEEYTFQGGFHREVLGVTNSHQVALRENGDIFYVNGLSGVKRISGNTTQTLSGKTKAKVNVDANDQLLISWTNNTKAYARLYDASTHFVRNYQEDGNINGAWAPAFNNCQFIIAGDESNQATDFHTYRKAHFQAFNCSDCRVGGEATASAKFRYPNQMLEMNSKFGPIDIAELCLVDKLLVDGSASCNEDRYFVSVTEFDLMNWSDVNVLHSGWVAQSLAPNDIDITDFLPQGYQLRPGKVYKFKLAVGQPWDEVSIFFTVTCCKRDIVLDPNIPSKEVLDTLRGGGDTNPVEPEEPLVDVFPNPAKDYVTIDFSKEEMLSEALVSIRDFSGKEVVNMKSKKEKVKIDLKGWKKGIYICTIRLNGREVIKRIVKE